MPILIISDRDPQGWIEAIKNEDKNVEVEVYPDVKDKSAIEFALVWNHPPGVFKEFPNIKVISSMGAGVDHILRDPELPEDARVTRIVDEQLATDMGEFVLARVMSHLRNLSLHEEFSRQEEWKPKTYRRIQDTKIGIMGMGNLGTTVGKKLTDNGFEVSGWANSRKDLGQINVFAGKEELEDFLMGSDILVCLLPLTPDTENILNREVFEKLPKDAYLINVARGSHLQENDLIEMLDIGHLSGAALDVFREEPLPQGHPFWKHEKIRVTPHIASVSKPQAAVPQILENYRRMQSDEPLQNVVDKNKGY